MKRTVCFLLLIAMALSLPVFAAEAGADAPDGEKGTRELGTMYVSKLNSIWVKPYDNCMILITPGSTVTGLYYHKLYAVYDEERGGYVVKKKVPAHIAYTQPVGAKSFGICFNYTTIVSAGASEARKNWQVWCRIREGDLLMTEGIDLTAKTIDVSGTWGTSDFVSNAKINVTTTREEFSGSAYSDVKIVALGDSLTPNGGWTETIGDMLGTDIINAGEGADRTDEAIKRFDNDVAAFDPDIVLIMFGANDLNQLNKYNSSLRVKFENNLQTLHDKCAAIGAKAVFMTPTKMDYSYYESKFTEQGGIDYCYKTFLQTIKDVAERNGCVFVDNFAPWDKLEDVKQYIIDSGHPNAQGYALLIGTVSEALIYNSEFLTGKKIFSFNEESKDGYGIKENRYLTGVKAGATAEEIKEIFDSVVETDAVVGTGCEIRCVSDKGYISGAMKIVINGDTDGSGKIDTTDYLTLKRVLLGTLKVEGAFKLACDTNSDGGIDSTDYLLIKRHLLKISSLF